MNDLARLYTRIGYHFKDESVASEALSHRSRSSVNYERLEFLGDSLLNFVIADELYKQHPEVDEGSLSRLRASLVRGTTLAEIARELELGEFLLMGSGELKSGGFDRDSILADVVESLVGGIYCEAGFDTARNVVLQLFRARIENVPPAEDLKDPKTRLQELMQGGGHARPEYEVLGTEGQAHELQFTVSCTLPSHKLKVTATASSRRKAEQTAAAAMYDKAQAVVNPSSSS